jgi:hypothetical protein
MTLRNALIARLMLCTTMSPGILAEAYQICHRLIAAMTKESNIEPSATVLPKLTERLDSICVTRQ